MFFKTDLKMFQRFTLEEDINFKMKEPGVIVMKMFKLNKKKYMKFVEPTSKIRIIPG